ncbi:unnamed protein product (macronuclear) [Paramecium tetraurelia]|uniref:Uncharacterized protein n=1 Tax=Paramecium tetraurelia TaxID=5888 RepID=A0BVY1_PARTE|nr:uncharacterized protein GSPATT00032550001 [Paramecium tetraurelia]CAK62698.1 unnamed protein product [Paramecium tetraurelia]|eukprot:XP_001430096.1 hypothetical protein (macronuclear) [Paramecium tetraurelia strain d4-2]
MENGSSSQLQKFQEHGLYQFILNRNRVKAKIVKTQQQITPLKQKRPSTALVESQGKQKLHMSLGLQLESFSTIQPKQQIFEEHNKNNSLHQAIFNPNQKPYANDQKIMRAMSTLSKIKNQRAFRPCPFTMGFNIEQCAIKPKSIKERSISQLQQIKSLNRTDVIKYKRFESPQILIKAKQQGQLTKWEQYDDSNLFDLNFLNNNLFKYEL